MCLPSSLLKAGSQLHSSRDSKEAEGPSLVQGKADPCWSVPAGAGAGMRARGPPPLPASPRKLRPGQPLAAGGSGRRAMAEEPATAHGIPPELTSGCRGHQPGPAKGTANVTANVTG